MIYPGVHHLPVIELLALGGLPFVYLMADEVEPFGVLLLEAPMLAGHSLHTPLDVRHLVVVNLTMTSVYSAMYSTKTMAALPPDFVKVFLPSQA